MEYTQNKEESWTLDTRQPFPTNPSSLGRERPDAICERSSTYVEPVHGLQGLEHVDDDVGHVRVPADAGDAQHRDVRLQQRQQQPQGVVGSSVHVHHHPAEEVQRRETRGPPEGVDSG